MTEPGLNYVHCPDPSGGHRMAYWEWGNPRGRHVVICVHGLSRQGRDFDVLARALCDRGGDDLRVICPDVAGRGQSDWLKDPMLYQLSTYAADMQLLLAELQPVTLDWVGTSMGGLIGIVLCGQAGLRADASVTGADAGVAGGQALAEVRRLVLNDVGPTIQWQALQRIGQYLGQGGPYGSLQEAADALWAIASSFGPHTPAQWLDLTRPMVKPVGDGSGRLRLHYDPAIAVPFRAVTSESAAQGETLLWHLYEQIRATTLLLRGADSDLLSRETAQAMTQRGPKAQLVSFAGVGHAPTLVAEDQVRTVVSFLLD